MIIFTPIKDIPQEYLLVKGIKNVVKWNLSSYFNDVPSLNYLLPDLNNMDISKYNGDCSSVEFDMDYHYYIINNDCAFIQLMNIMIPAFSDPSTLVQVLIRESNFRDIITESLCKLIQQRYGYQVCIINELNDFLYAEDLDFSVPGLIVFDTDKDRFNSIASSSYDMRGAYPDV